MHVCTFVASAWKCSLVHHYTTFDTRLPAAFSCSGVIGSCELTEGGREGGREAKCVKLQYMPRNTVC